MNGNLTCQEVPQFVLHNAQLILMTLRTITKTTLSFEITLIAKAKKEKLFLFFCQMKINCYPMYLLSSSLKSFGLDFVPL